MRTPHKDRPMPEQDMLHAHVDHQLDEPDIAEVDATLNQDEAARAAVIAWQAQNDQLRALEQEALAEPVPPALVAATRRRRNAGAHTGVRFGGDLWPQALAACLLLGVGLAGGWIAHRAWSSHEQIADNTSLARGLMRDAMVAHTVYAADARRPVEVAASDQDQLLRWLSRRLGRPLKLPALADLGWSLVGGRLLPGDTGGASSTRAQFMYEDKGGQRLTLYLSVLDPPLSAAGTSTVAATAITTDGRHAPTTGNSAASTTDQPADLAGHTAFSYASRDSTHSFYWTEDNFGYALVGELPREVLERISNEVYQQTVAAADPARMKR
jgi:anti-sigma factor RsiW